MMKNRIKIGIPAIGLLAGALFGGVPQWWLDRGVINTNLTPSDYAPVNQGQAKHVVRQAYLEFEQKLGSAGPGIVALVAGFSESGNLLPVNLGQLKYLAAPFYNQLDALELTNVWPAGMTLGPYPWSGSVNPSQDYAIANIGQLKYLLSFYFEARDGVADTDGDELPDWLEAFNGWAPDNSDTDGDGMLDSAELNVRRTDPGNADTLPPIVCINAPANWLVIVP